jgi:alkanesulfonate monooxygenase SsuD/methylene tetrahydromethanopterin reductase-like flavin-dependent oxidoreductase (luciferase family)
MRELMRFGVQTATQNTTTSELRATWKRLETAGYEWISIWDHFYAVGGGTSSLEAVSLHAALAMETSTVRCGSLVYSVGYRNLAVLANAIATIDHLSDGRATLGLGAGYLEHEYEAWGIPFGSAPERLTQLEETVSAARRLLDGETVTTSGEFVELHDAVCDPRPVQRRLPIWIGGGGELRTIPMAARLADGWNVPMATVDDFQRKVRVLDEHLAQAGRQHDEIERSVGLGLCRDRSTLRARYGERADVLAPSILSGSTDEIVDKVSRYADAGADWIFVSVRAPFDIEELEQFAADIIPAFS